MRISLYAGICFHYLRMAVGSIPRHHYLDVPYASRVKKGKPEYDPRD
jgi:hypothetical protein